MHNGLDAFPTRVRAGRGGVLVPGLFPWDGESVPLALGSGNGSATHRINRRGYGTAYPG